MEPGVVVVLIILGIILLIAGYCCIKQCENC